MSLFYPGLIVNFSFFAISMMFTNLAVGAPVLRSFSGHSILEVEDFLEAENITTLKDFLPRLPIESRANFVLMRQSASLQPTKDTMNPRAILFGADGSLVFAFNHSSQSIEVMEKKADHFEFERLNFVEGRRPSKQTNCAICHDGHPLWGQYRSWAGMYGGDQEMIPTGSSEEQDYVAFLQRAQADELYRSLVFKCGSHFNGGIVPGFVDRSWVGNMFPACQEVSSLSHGHSEENRAERRLEQPGEALNELLNRSNAARLYFNVRKSGRYSLLKYAVAANFLGCLGTKMYEFTPDLPALSAMRSALAELAGPIESRIADLAKVNSSTWPSTQAQIFILLGLQLSDLRMDIRANGRSLGNDCESHSSYSPNPYCRPGFYGYEAYSDGTDMGADLISYLVLREVYASDADFRAQLRAGLQSVQDYFSRLPVGTGSGYGDGQAVLSYLVPLMRDLESPGDSPATIPKYMSAYPIAQLPRWGHGAEICRSLLSQASQGSQRVSIK